MALLPTELPGSFNPFDQGNIIAESAPSLIIQELTGEKRSLTLKQRSLPYTSVSWAGNMRTNTTWYQGNPVATQQVLGPEEEPTTLEGTWKDRFIRGTVEQVGFGREVAFATDLVDFMTELRTAGQLLQVSWGPETRRGILVMFDPRYLRLQDIEWTAEFEWQGRGPVTPRVPEPDAPPPTLLDRINQVADQFALGPTFLFPDVNAILVSNIADAREKTATVFDGLRVVQKLAEVPQDVLGAVASAVDSLRNQLLEEMNRLAETPVELVSTSTRAADVLSVEAWRREMSAALERLLDALDAADRQLENRAEPPATQTFQATENITLFAISNRFYETPDFAGFLQRVNFLDSNLVPAGFTLIIPPKPNTSGA